jgi:hypothetical protein
MKIDCILVKLSKSNERVFFPRTTRFFVKPKVAKLILNYNPKFLHKIPVIIELNTAFTLFHRIFHNFLF